MQKSWILSKMTSYCRSAKKLLEKVESATLHAEKEIHTNVIDPFSAIFDAMSQGITLEEWLKQEKARQIQKTLQNHIGEFHQSLIGSVQGWEDLQVGHSIDLRNRDKKIIAELKNKYNTLNSASQLALYDKLQKHLDYDESHKGYTAYCVHIIPKNPRPLNTEFHPAERGTRRPKRSNIRVIDGRSFYELATGDADSLEKLYYHLPHIIGIILKQKSHDFVSTSMFVELYCRAYTS